jgi:CRP/FNR family transcriptional regulator
MIPIISGKQQGYISPPRSSTVPEVPEIQLEEAEFFRALAKERLDRVRTLLVLKRFDRHAVLFFAGQPADHLWVVRRGEVRLYKSSVDGRLATLETLHAGQAFGAISALGQEEYPASAEAMRDGSAWCLPRSVVLTLLRDEPQLAVEVLQIVSGRLRQAHERLRSFAHDPAPARLASALLDAAHQGEARTTRRALAETAGTTVETAIRVLRRFEREGLIRGAVGRVEVLNAEELRRMSGENHS